MSASAYECVRLHLKSYLLNHDLSSWLTARAPRQFEPFYSSIDLRDAGFKLAPVDANLYPAGFNNICSEDLESSVAIVKPLLQRHFGRMPKRIAILPELHTRNRFYVDNLYELRQVFRRLGIEAEVGWLTDPTGASTGRPAATPEPVQLQMSNESHLTAFPFWREGSRLMFEPFEPEFILLNNDFSAGFPEILRDLAQPIEPSPRLGWHTRKKSDFFENYDRLAGELARTAGIDPWQIQVATRHVDNLDFDSNEGMDRVADAAAEVLEEMREQYQNRGIDEQPYVFVKSNAGTYGMGILRVEHPEQLLKLNRRERNKMAVVKNQLVVRDVIVQEGIPTRYQTGGVFAEPVIYLMGHELLGGFLRKNPGRGKVDNLNTRGMVFQKLCINDLRTGADRDLELELVYGTIAQLSAAAVTLEIAKAEEKVERSARDLTNTSQPAV